MADINKIGEDILNAPQGGTMGKEAQAVPLDRAGPIPGTYEALGAAGDFLTGQTYDRPEGFGQKAVNKTGQVLGDFLFGGGKFMQDVSVGNKPQGSDVIEAGLNLAGPAAKVVAPAAIGFGWMWKQMGREAPEAAKGVAKKMGGFFGGRKAIDRMDPTSKLVQDFNEADKLVKSGMITTDEELKGQFPNLTLGLEGKLKFEMSDEGMRWGAGKPEIKKGGFTKAQPLGEVVDHQVLFDTYPELKDNVDIKWKNLGDKFKGYFHIDEDGGHIVLNSLKKDSAWGQLTTTIHEIQHSIQAIEDFSRGGNADTIRETLQMLMPKDFVASLSDEQLTKVAAHLYKLKAGEVEARLVQNRLASQLKLATGNIENTAKAGDTAQSLAERIDVKLPKYVWNEKTGAGEVQQIAEKAAESVKKEASK